MKTVKHVLTSTQASVDAWCTKYLEVEDYLQESKKEAYITVSFNKDQMRSNALNSLAEVYYSIIAGNQHSALEIKAFCKMQFGIALLDKQGAGDTQKAQEAKERTTLLNDLRFNERSYQAKIRLMKAITITSLMTKPIFWDYLREIEQYYWTHQHLKLESINETLRNNALNIK